MYRVIQKGCDFNSDLELFKYDFKSDLVLFKYDFNRDLELFKYDELIEIKSLNDLLK